MAWLSPGGPPAPRRHPAWAVPGAPGQGGRAGQAGMQLLVLLTVLVSQVLLFMEGLG